MHHFEVIAHRGYSAAHPENTLAAFEAALAAGADLIEADVRLSQDGVVVISHDADLRRLAGRGERVDAMTAAELAAIRLPDGGAMTTLAPILDLVLDPGHRPARVVFDIKVAGPKMMETLLAEVCGRGMRNDVVFAVRSLDQLAHLRLLSPGATALALLDDPADLPAFFAGGGDIARLWEEDVSADSLAPLRAAGRTVWVTAGQRRRGEAAGEIDAPRLRRLLDLGADGVLVNDPHLALTVRAEAGAAHRNLTRAPAPAAAPATDASAGPDGPAKP